MAEKFDLLQGTLDLLILKAVSLGPLHEYSANLGGSSTNPARSLYLALYRLEHQGWFVSQWGESDKRKAKYCRLTASGRRALQAETEYWDEMTDAIAAVLRATLEAV